MIGVLSLLLAAPIKVAIVGDTDALAMVRGLRPLLGAAYDVKGFGSPTTGYLVDRPMASDVGDYGPSVVILALGTRDAAPSLWASRRDTFVPSVAAYVEALRALPTHPKVKIVLPSLAKPEHDLAAGVVPLLRQAARESDVPVVETGADRGQDLVEDVADAVSDPRVAKAGWRLVEADSEETDEGPARLAIDGDPNTYWHTRYDPTAAPYPHYLVVDMGDIVTIGSFRYVPRQDGGVNGRVKAYEFYVSLDGQSWSSPVASGTFPNTSLPTRVRFAHPVTARFFRFTALSEQSGGPWASAAEIDVMRAAPE